MASVKPVTANLLAEYSERRRVLVKRAAAKDPSKTSLSRRRYARECHCQKKEKKNCRTADDGCLLEGVYKSHFVRVGHVISCGVNHGAGRGFCWCPSGRHCRYFVPRKVPRLYTLTARTVFPSTSKSKSKTRDRSVRPIRALPTDEALPSLVSWICHLRRHFLNCFQAWTSSWIARAGGKVWLLMMRQSR